MNDRLDWPKTRVLLTGGNGFLGRHVLAALKRRGPAALIAPRSHEYDLRRLENIRLLLADFRPDLVIHMAARVGGIGANLRHPAEFFYDNLMMGTQLIHESWSSGVKKFVALGTICAYPKLASVPFREDDIWSGYPEETNAPYGLAKKMLLVQSQAYRKQYGFNSIYLLPVNLYGPGDNFDLENSHVIPAMVRKFVEARRSGAPEVVLWGTGSPTREFFFVEDCAEGILLAAERYNGPEPVNLGSGMEISIRDLAAIVAKLSGFSGKIRWDRSRPDGQPRRNLDVSKAKQLFGFMAHADFETGLRKTIAWYEEFVAPSAERSPR